MFSIEFLHTIREHEINTISKHFAPGARILEIGGGTGYQAKLLTERGFDVTTIDVGTSNYKGERVFPVTDYDGKVFPVADATFDVVFSSNVLEHIVDLAQVHQESRRVLKPDGYCVHVMPTTVWRFWTGIAHYVELCRCWAGLVLSLFPRSLSRHELGRAVNVFREMIHLGGQYAVVPRHGEAGNALTELWTFNRRCWLNHFRRHGYSVFLAEEMGLFYTGHKVFGKHWGLRSRARVARVLGSAAVLYVVKPNARFHEGGDVSERAVHKQKVGDGV